MTTAMYAIKRAIVDRLTLASAPGLELDGVQIAYAHPGSTIAERCVYFGGTVFDQPGVNDVVDGDDYKAQEVDTIRAYVRVFLPGQTVRDAEAEAERIGDDLGMLLRKEPGLAGVNTYTRIAGGTGDYSPTDDGPIVILAYRLLTTAYV